MKAIDSTYTTDDSLTRWVSQWGSIVLDAAQTGVQR